MAKLLKGKAAKKKNAAGVVLLLLAGLAMAGALSAYAYMVMTKDVLDVRNCPSRGPSSVTVVLVDATDTFTPRQMEDIRQGIGGLVHDLKEGDELQIFTLRPDGKKVREADFNQCKPKENGNQWIENTRQVRDKFEAEFKAKLDVALDAAIQSQPANESPTPADLPALPLLQSILRARRQRYCGPALVQYAETKADIGGSRAGTSCLVLLRQHQCQDTCRFQRICRVF